MKRTRVSWSNMVDQIEGPCVVCGQQVYFVLPADRPDPAILFHPTCDVMPKLREQLKSAKPPVLPPEYVIPRRAAPAPVAAVPAAAVAPSTAAPVNPPKPA
jgi:hypothetical protein